MHEDPTRAGESETGEEVSGVLKPSGFHPSNFHREVLHDKENIYLVYRFDQSETNL